MKLGSVGLRLIRREYLPFAGWILAWTIIAFGIGHADAARLLAALMLVRAARAFTTMDTGTAMRRRHGAPAPVYRTSLLRAARIEIVSLAADCATLAVLILGLIALDQEKAAWMTALVGIGLPARHFAPAGGARRRSGLFRLVLPWSGVAMAAIAVLADLGWTAVVLVMGLREWVALLIVLAPGIRPPPDPNPKPLTTPLDWREVAAITATRARHRLNYRISKGILGSLFGPFGGILARTGRGIGAHRRFDRVTPRSFAAMAVLAFGALAGAILIQMALAKPATLIASASLARIAAAAGSVLIWWRFSATAEVDDEDDDED